MIMNTDKVLTFLLIAVMNRKIQIVQKWGHAIGLNHWQLKKKINCHSNTGSSNTVQIE